MSIPRLAILTAVVGLVCADACAETLSVGPGGKFAKPSDALKVAKDGDVIEIDVKGNYDGDVSYVAANNLTVRGVGGKVGPTSQPARAVLDAKGKSAGRKGIFVTKGKDITIENIEFRNAGGEVNAAGIRAEGENLTVRNCRFFECRDAILGGTGRVLIEYCEFSHCGHNANPATHNLYISERVTKLIYRYNYSTHTYEGHLLKSRAKENWILHSRLTDEAGQGSAVADFPNGGLVVMVGNALHKGPNGKNNRMIAFGMEGIKHDRNEIYVINNTMWWDNRRPNDAWFVRINNRAARAQPGAASQPAERQFKAVIANNLCVGPIALCNQQNITAKDNLVVRTVAEAGFVDPVRFDFHLKPDSPAIDKADIRFTNGESLDADADHRSPRQLSYLRPTLEYVHPSGQRNRPADAKLDVGAFEFERARMR